MEFVHEFVARPRGRLFIEALWDEAAETLEPPAGLDVAAYRAALMKRFSNVALQHRTRQIAMDGSQKLPQRLLAPIEIRLERGQSIDALALAVAAWVRWLGGRTDDGKRFVVEDPLSSELNRCMVSASGAFEQVRALLELRSIFPADLAVHPAFVTALTRSLELLETRGAKGALAVVSGKPRQD